MSLVKMPVPCWWLLMTGPHHKTRAHADHHCNRPVPPPKPTPAPLTREELAARFGRRSMGEIWQAIVEQHGGNPPGPVCWQHQAEKREAVRCQV